MKRLIIASMEIESHSGTSIFITTTEATYKQALRSLLYYEDEPIYNLVHETIKDDGSAEQFYDGELGEMSVLIKPFKAMKEIQNKEFYTRTG